MFKVFSLYQALVLESNMSLCMRKCVKMGSHQYKEVSPTLSTHQSLSNHDNLPLTGNQSPSFSISMVRSYHACRVIYYPAFSNCSLSLSFCLCLSLSLSVCLSLNMYLSFLCRFFCCCCCCCYALFSQLKHYLYLVLDNILLSRKTSL